MAHPGLSVYLGRDLETKKRNYHNRTIHGSMREAQAYLTRKLRERDLGRDLEGAKITLNEYLDRWLETAVGPRVRPKPFQDYQGMLYWYVRPVLGERVLAALRPLDLQAVYQHMTERGLSARTVRYAHVLMKCAMQQAVRWRLLLENPADGLKAPQQVRNEMRSLTVEQARVLLKAADGTKYGAVLAVALTTGTPYDQQDVKLDVSGATFTCAILRFALYGRRQFGVDGDKPVYEHPTHLLSLAKADSALLRSSLFHHLCRFLSSSSGD